MTFEAHLKQTARSQTSASEAKEWHEVAAVEIGLNAAILAVRKDEPVALVVRPQGETVQVSDSLPFGPFSPLEHLLLVPGSPLEPETDTQPLRPLDGAVG